MHRKILLSWAMILFLSPSFAQQDEWGNWLMYFGQNRISDQFSIHSEVQYRNHTVAPVNIEQLMLRTGLNYHFASNAFATAGYAYIPSYVYESEQKNPETTEHRIWQQLIMTNKLGRVKFEHRYRVEQRWVNGDYRNRLRYRLMLFLPLNKPDIEKGTVLLGLYDEIFVNTERVSSTGIDFTGLWDISSTKAQVYRLAFSTNASMILENGTCSLLYFLTRILEIKN